MGSHDSETVVGPPKQGDNPPSPTHKVLTWLPEPRTPSTMGGPAWTPVIMDMTQALKSHTYMYARAHGSLRGGVQVSVMCGMMWLVPPDPKGSMAPHC